MHENFLSPLFALDLVAGTWEPGISPGCNSTGKNYADTERLSCGLDKRKWANYSLHGICMVPVICGNPVRNLLN
jgi:hypothetical protein